MSSDFAVRKITGTLLRERISRSAASPSSPGIMISSSTSRISPSRSSASSASRPPYAQTAR